MGVPRVSVIVLTKNEAGQIEACLESAKALADELIVVDSVSDDDTVARCRRYTDKVYIRPYQRYARTRNWALKFATGDWILPLDADERLTPELIAELRTVLATVADDVNGLRIPYVQYCFGRLLQSWRYRELRAKMHRRDKAYYPEKEVHPVLQLSQGRWLDISSALEHIPYPRIRDYFEKYFRYIRWDAEELVKTGARKTVAGFIKLWIRPWCYFIRDVVLNRAWRDGWQGLFMAFFSAWYPSFKELRFYSGAAALDRRRGKCA